MKCLWQYVLFQGFNLLEDSLAKSLQIEPLHFLPSPRRSAQELETGLHRRLKVEAVDGDEVAQFIPAVVVHKRFYHVHQLYAVQWIVGLG